MVTFTIIQQIFALQATSSQRILSDWEFRIKVKDFPPDFKTRFDALTNRKMLGLKMTCVLYISLHYWQQTDNAKFNLQNVYYFILQLFYHYIHFPVNFYFKKNHRVHRKSYHMGVVFKSTGSLYWLVVNIPLELVFQQSPPAQEENKSLQLVPFLILQIALEEQHCLSTSAYNSSH